MSACIKTSIMLPRALITDLKIMCALTHSKQSDFIRIAIRDKVSELKKQRHV